MIKSKNKSCITQKDAYNAEIRSKIDSRNTEKK